MRDANHPFRQRLERLRTICEKGEQRSKHGHIWRPVYDIANHFILTEPIDDCSLPTRDLKVAKAIVRELNDQMVTVDSRDLERIRCWVVAGGPRKVYALYSAIQRFKVETLVTDERTARALIEIKTRHS